MPTTPNVALLIAGTLSALAALAHLACIVFGVSWYRFFGAGEQMLRLVEAGSTYPTKMTVFIATVLLVWAAYAYSGAGLLPRLPFLKLILCAITAVYLLRGFLFFPLMPRFPGNSMTFWLVSGAICATIGIVHVIGIRQAWENL